jgi:hypothetical protein
MHSSLNELHCAGIGRCVLMAALIIGPVLGGCHKPDPPPVAYAGPTLVEADLGLASPVQAEANGYVVLERASSQGLFPSSLAVVRLDKPNPLFVCEDPLFVCDRGWEVATLKPEEGVYWSLLLRTVPQAQAVILMDRQSVLSPDCDLAQVIDAMRRQRIGLCLIYGPRLVPDGAAGLAGVIIDVATGEYMAYVQSEAGALDFEPPRPDRPHGDRAHQDVNYLAARRFEKQVRACVLELIDRDERPATTQPSPWRNMDELRLPSDAVPVYIVPNHQAG